MNRPLAIRKIDSTGQFLYLFNNANEFYISSRYNLQEGYLIIGAVNAHQAIELYIKAILKLGYKYERGHNLIKLLEKHKSKEKYFSELLQNDLLYGLLMELSSAYFELRYGEGGYEADNIKIIKLLDGIAYNLRRIYFQTIKSPFSKLYLKGNARLIFLKDNDFFKESDLTSDPLGVYGLVF